MFRPKRYLLLTALLVATTMSGFGQAEELRREVAFMADSVGNRYPASDGELLVRSRIARHFAECGLECEIQPFDVVEEIWGDGSLQLIKVDTIINFTYGKEFVVSGRSAADTLSAEYVIIGALPDSLHGLMRRKVVVCLPKVPPMGSKAKIPTITEMVQAGACAVVYVNPPTTRVKSRVSTGNRHHRPHTIPILSVNHDELAKFMPQSVAESYTAENAYIAPPSDRLKIATHHYEKHLQSTNIMGLKRGSGEKYIVVGAHYDTLAPDPESGESRRGANDNASGVAVVMALAKRLSGTTTHHNIVFVAFGCEEKGALGSMNFMAQLPFAKEAVTEMINLDMVGRMEKEVLYYCQFNDTRLKAADLQPSSLVLVEGEVGMSDHYDFVKAGIGTSCFHTGYDTAIHTPSDTSDRLNYEGMAAIVDFLADYILKVDKHFLCLGE